MRIYTDASTRGNFSGLGYIATNSKNVEIHKIRDMMTARNYNLFWIKGHCQDGTILSFYNKRADKMSKVVRKQYEKDIKEAKKQKLLRHIKGNIYGG